jgi:hypothetical protein
MFADSTLKPIKFDDTLGLSCNYASYPNAKGGEGRLNDDTRSD